jgi:ABC-2 type transport system ATP-binding protein
MSQMLEIRNLTKRFGPMTAVDNVSFTVGRGEVLGFLGPNGAGKSTTMKVVTGFLPPTSGTAIVAGFDVTESPIEVKKRVGYLPEGAPLYEDMTPESFLMFIAEIRGLSGAERRTAVDRAADLINVSEVMQQPIGTLSKGFKRRVGLAQAILHDPEVLVLDEPTDGLDPNQKFEVRQLIKDMAENKAIIISTHILEEVDAVCSRAIVISRGRIVADGKPDELESRSPRHNAISIRIDARHTDRAHDALIKVAGVASVEVIDRAAPTAHLLVMPENGKLLLQEVGACVRAADIAVEQMSAERGHLDDVFRQITSASRGA